MTGILYIVATPLGNLEDMTFRAVRVLKEVDLIAAEDTRHTQKLLNHFGIQTPLTSYFQGNEREKLEKIIHQLELGKNVALVSDAGTPCISDPGFPLLRDAVTKGIHVIPIPGPSAVIAALSAAGLPTDRFTFVGFLPDKPGKRKNALEELKLLNHTLVIYLSPWKAQKTLVDALEVLGDRNVVLCRELTKIYEEFLRGSLSSLIKVYEEKPPKGEMVLIVGYENL
ncbi:MAG: 16S rRNA (cytidine(1402)-2'-O)-methyltransferase [Deltaproteobacteria bacterium RIFCSPLOWO2_02_FULL_44_10]|nr:MAG: 16S rRNA (cytidine(1402)-2'-O)-methyltransferase [Deltaproteobacteria bacterium RIFCSPHIGHO2_02_FULL_44_16]OGQ46634.1 MAG: 16S rRNA (cytidine(1402)-2'-O)-methyltransferase [Deltaproteobacteria bacterium RIFCSPLOWO2_02_FULL_44_10]